MSAGKNLSFFKRTITTITTLMVVLVTASCAPAAQALPVTGAASSSQVQINQALVVSSAPGSPSLIPIDLSTGKPVEGLEPIHTSVEFNYTLSPDRQALALYSRGSACLPGCLRIFDLASLKQTAIVDLPLFKRSTNWVVDMTYNPQGTLLAIVTSTGGAGEVVMIDLSGVSPREVGRAGLPAFLRFAEFTAEGGQLMVVGSSFPDREAAPGNNPLPQAVLIDAASLEVLWTQDLEGIKDGMYGTGDHSKPEENIYFQAGMAVDTLNRLVYIAHADADQLTTVDFGKRTVRTVDIRPKRSLIERLLEPILSIGLQSVQAKAMNSVLRDAVLASDGRTLYVVGERTTMVPTEDDEWNTEAAPLGLVTWDVRTGEQINKVETAANAVRLTPDGSLLLIGYDRTSTGGWPWMALYDPSKNQVTNLTRNTYAATSFRLDGTPILVSSEYDFNGKATLAVLDEKTLQPVTLWPEDVQKDYYWLEIR